jgi:regulator of protease activity HflC (stomatin/prohibitin superfamily)
MTLVSGPNGGSEAVPCVMRDQQTIAMDSSTSWSVDPHRVADLYRMRPGVPLTGDPKGQDLAAVLVRPEIRAGLRDACTRFGWEEAYGARRLEYEAAAEQAVRGRLESVGIKVRSVSIRAMVPSPALESLIAARLDGQKQTEAALFQQQQAERNGLAQQANAKAAAELQIQQARATAELQAEQSKAALAKARADADQARITAESEAARIRALGDAEAYANRQKASTISPEMVELEKWRRWDGKMPQTVLGNDPILQMPVPGR